jgi:Caspase domain
MKRKMKLILGIISLICVVLLVSPACTAGLRSLSLKKKNAQTQGTTQSQYWALLFAVGVYENAPDEDRPEMLQACDDLNNALIDSPQFWQTSNIHVVTGSQALLQNLIKELLWLRKNSKSEDYVLVYITTHGGQLKRQGLPWDLPPKDETDGSDELLVMYNGFNTWYGIIWDDMLNFFLSMIKCKGLCLIVDSCYSGGFNDSPFTATEQDKYTAESFVTGFVEDLAAPGRVILMSCQENEVSYGTYFSDGLISGFQGWADFFGNGDGINSAEEAFSLAKTLVELQSDQHPTIVDSYPGEFPVTYT